MVRKKESHEILSLVGLLQHATKVVNQGGPSYLDCIQEQQNSESYTTTLSLQKILDQIFSGDMSSSIVGNGISFLESIHSRTTADYYIATGASGSWSCGGCFKEHYT